MLVEFFCDGHVLFALELLVDNPVFSNLLNVCQMGQSWVVCRRRISTLANLISHVLRVNHGLNVVEDRFTALLIFAVFAFKVVVV